MNLRTWLPPVVFLATAVPTVMLLHAFDIAADFRVVIAIGAGALATAIAQARLARRKDDSDA